MKKLFSTLTLTVCLGAFISCTNDEQEVNMVKPTNANSEIEVINDGTMIKFKDVESYENALLKVSAMSTSEQVSFLNSLSFKSQMILMQEADGELDKICNQAADKAEFDVLYEKYKHKYGDVFMFNTIDATDLSPYSRLVYVANEYFVNMKGEFMIGDSLVVDKVYTDFKERQQQFTVSTRSSVSDLSSINEAYSRQKDRKVGLYLSVSSGIIHANFTSQKKGVFGWSRYSTTYHAKVNLRGFEFAQGELLGDNDGAHSPVEIIVQKALKAGLHPIEVRYFDCNGGVLQMELVNEKGEKEVLPKEWLKHE